MARFSGATVLLILVATVSVYTCAILGGAALGRTLDRLPTTKQPAADSTLQVSVSFRSLAQDFAKELWGGNHRESRSGDAAHARAGERAATALPQLMLVRGPLREICRSDGVHEGAATVGTVSMSLTMSIGLRLHTTCDGRTNQTARPLSRHSNFSGEITEGTLPGGVVKVGPWGGSGGQAYFNMGIGGGASPPRLLSVTLYHADAVHAFSFEYLQGTVVRRTYTGLSGDRYYGSKGRRATINFARDEHVTAVEGTFGRSRSVTEVVVTSLTFRTDKGRTYGPYGEETGTPFSIPAANGCIVGFWGRSGRLLDAIGVYIMPCQVDKPAFFVSNAYKATS
ncbi:unnamed protein product [Alopecurus aequalis]